MGRRVQYGLKLRVSESRGLNFGKSDAAKSYWNGSEKSKPHTR